MDNYTKEPESRKCFSQYCSRSNLLTTLSDSKVDIIKECFRGQLYGDQNWEHLDFLFQFIIPRFANIQGEELSRDSNRALEVARSVLSSKEEDCYYDEGYPLTTCFRLLPIANLEKRVCYDSEAWLFLLILSHCQTIPEAFQVYEELCRENGTCSPVSSVVNWITQDIPLTWAISLS
jgi:hypothetical protein